MNLSVLSSFLRPIQMSASSYSPKPSPAILVVPADLNFACVDLAPPIFKFCTRDVERGRGDQMIEDDRVLLAPAEFRKCFQIVVVEKMSRNCAAGNLIQRVIDKLCRRIQERRRQFRKMQKRARTDPRSNALTQRIDPTRDPFVVLCSINPGGKM